MTTVSSTSSTASNATTTSSTASSASSATQALLASLGGSSIDVTGLATQLASAEYSGQVDQLNTRNTSLSTQISEASALMNMTSSLASSFNSLITTGQLASTPLIANSQVATISAGTVQGSGTATLEVTALAQGQTLASPTLPATTTDFGSGSLTITLGTVSGSSFAASSSQSPVTIAIPAGSSLAAMATAINQAGAGVNAYVATNAHGQQLVLTGLQGASNAFTVSASENAGDPGLAQFAWSPASTSNGASLAAAASDASYRLNGVQRTASSNAITDAAPGISLNLTGTNAGNPTTISFTDPTAGVASGMNDLVSALNTIVSTLNTDTAPGAALNNNPGARALRSTLSSLASAVVMPNAQAGAPATLGDLGLSIGKDGTFVLNQAQLNSALHNHPQAVAAMFTTGANGIYSTIFNLSHAVNDPTNGGALAGSVKTLTAQQSTIATQLTSIANQQAKMRTNLINQFAALNSVVAAGKSTQSFLTQQVALWTKSSNG